MRIVNKRKFLKGIFTIIFIIIVSFICLNQLFNKEEIKSTEMQYTVSKGERLWDIAEQYKRPDQDIREYIYEIKKLNNMENSTIYEGQELTIIIYEEVK